MELIKRIGIQLRLDRLLVELTIFGVCAKDRWLRSKAKELEAKMT
jgi:hypothetical protein